MTKVYEISKKTKYAYGCIYCGESVLKKKTEGGVKLINYGKTEGEGSKLFCPYEECPYKDEIEQYKDYKEYDKAIKEKWNNKNIALW